VDRRNFVQMLGATFLGGVASSAGTYLATRPHAQRAAPGLYVQLGTSITAGVHAPGADLTPSVVGARLNLDAVNLGFDGACCGIYPGSNEPISLCRMVDAIVSASWSRQDSGLSFEPHKRTLRKAKAIDFSKVTHLGLEYGINDCTVNAPIGILEQNISTFKGALIYSLQKLSISFPAIRVFLITPAWAVNYENRDSDLYPNKAGVFLREYVDAMLDVSSSMRVPCLDLWRRLNIAGYNYKAFTLDGAHPNREGAIRRGEMIAGFISGTF
jgi:hypothetical protein